MKGRARPGTRLVLLALMLMLRASPVFADLSELFSAWTQASGAFSDPNTGMTMFPTLLIPLGGRAEGMGTASTALADDPTLIDSNPAGSALIRNPALAVFHHNWIADSAVEAVVYIAAFRGIGFGLGGKIFYCPFTKYDRSGDRVDMGYLSEAMAVFNFSMRLLDIKDFASVSAGMNVKTVFRFVPEALAAGQSAFAVPLDFGILARLHLLDFSGSPGGNLSFAAVIRNLGQTVSPSNYPLPTLVSFGIAYAPIPPVTIAVDAGFPVSFESADLPAEQFDAAMGIELAVASFLSLHGGAHFKADNPTFSIGTTVRLGIARFTVNYNVDLMGGLNPVDMLSVAATVELQK